MAKKLAIEWDSQELRMVVARQRGSSVVVEQVFVTPLAAPEDSGGSVENRVARVLKEQASQHGLGKLPVLLGINRSAVELQVLNVPPVPDDELPDIVRFQAIREFASIGDDGTVDFVKLSPAADGRPRVHATAIAGKQLKSAHKILEQAQLHAERYYLRPFAAAHLAASQSRLSEKSFLLVDVLPDRVELTAVRAGEIVLSRSTRVPGEGTSEHYAQVLQGEVRRTILAARSKDSDATITQLVILGQPLTPAAWRQLGDDLQLSVEFLDPLHAEHVSSSLDAEPAASGQIGALVGMLLVDSTGSHGTVDFLNPRRKPDPPDRKRLFALAGLTAATVVLAIVYLLYSGIGSKDAKIEQLKQEIASLQKSNEALVQMENNIIEIDNWVRADVQWLDELYRMSDLLPSADEMIATRVHMQTASNVGGTVALEGYVTDPAVISKLETALRDDQHQVLGRESKNQEYGDTYRWSFQEYVTVIPEEQDRFAPRPETSVPNDAPAPATEATDAASQPDSTTPDATATDSTSPDSEVSDTVVPADADTDDAASVNEDAPTAEPSDAAADNGVPSVSESPNVAEANDAEAADPASEPEPTPEPMQEPAAEPMPESSAEPASEAAPAEQSPRAEETEAVRTVPQQEVAQPPRDQQS